MSRVRNLESCGFLFTNYLNLIYKFLTKEGIVLEVQQFEKRAILTTKYEETTTTVGLTPSQIYDLIGALHSIKTKIKNE